MIGTSVMYELKIKEFIRSSNRAKSIPRLRGYRLSRNLAI